MSPLYPAGGSISAGASTVSSISTEHFTSKYEQSSISNLYAIYEVGTYQQEQHFY